MDFSDLFLRNPKIRLICDFYFSIEAVLIILSPSDTSTVTASATFFKLKSFVAPPSI
jgi:hypothetical protein